MDLDLDAILKEAEKIINSIPDAKEYCECEHQFWQHNRLGKRNIWVCHGNYHDCLCVQFRRKKHEHS